MKSEKEKRIISNKGRVIKFINKYGWITKIEYRKSCNDMVIEQYTLKEKRVERASWEDRYIYLQKEHLEEISRILTKLSKSEHNSEVNKA